MSNFDNTISLPQVMPTRGMIASDAARLTLKSAGIDTNDPMGIQALTEDVMENLKSQGVDADPALVRSLAEQALKSQVGGGRLVTKATDPKQILWGRRKQFLQ